MNMVRMKVKVQFDSNEHGCGIDLVLIEVYALANIFYPNKTTIPNKEQGSYLVRYSIYIVKQ